MDPYRSYPYARHNTRGYQAVGVAIADAVIELDFPR